MYEMFIAAALPRLMTAAAMTPLGSISRLGSCFAHVMGPKCVCRVTSRLPLSTHHTATHYSTLQNATTSCNAMTRCNAATLQHACGASSRAFHAVMSIPTDDPKKSRQIGLSKKNPLLTHTHPEQDTCTYTYTYRDLNTHIHAHIPAPNTNSCPHPHAHLCACHTHFQTKRVLQCDAVCCSKLQCVAACYSVL